MDDADYCEEVYFEEVPGFWEVDFEGGDGVVFLIPPAS